MGVHVAHHTAYVHTGRDTSLLVQSDSYSDMHIQTCNKAPPICKTLHKKGCGDTKTREFQSIVSSVEIPTQLWSNGVGRQTEADKSVAGHASNSCLGTKDSGPLVEAVIIYFDHRRVGGRGGRRIDRRNFCKNAPFQEFCPLQGPPRAPSVPYTFVLALSIQSPTTCHKVLRGCLW